LNRNALKYFIVLAILSVIGIFVIQFAFLKNTFEITEKEFRETTTIALREVAWQILEASGETAKFDNIDPVEQVTPNCFLVNVNDVIDPEILKIQLKEQFKRHNIRLKEDLCVPMMTPVKKCCCPIFPEAANTLTISGSISPI